jgi:hypothetical protein
MIIKTFKKVPNSGTRGDCGVDAVMDGCINVQGGREKVSLHKI